MPQPGPLNENLQIEIERIMRAMRGENLDSKEYVALLRHLSELTRMQQEELSQRHKMALDNQPKSYWPSPDTMLTSAVYLLGILLIVKHEHVGNFISSKGLNFIPRPR